MKILLVQVSFLGDVILSTPLIEELKKKYPDSELWMMTTPLASKLLIHDSRLSGIIKFDKRKDHSGLFGGKRFIDELKLHDFDKVYSLHKSFRTAAVLYFAGIPFRHGFKESRGAFFYNSTVNRGKRCHDVLRNLSLLGVYNEEEAPNLKLSCPPREALSPFIQEVLPENEDYVLFVPGSAWKTKRWHWSRFRELAEIYIQEGRRVVVCGAPPEVEICNKVSEGLDVLDLSGKTQLEEMLLLIKNANLIVCNDSMALHIASTFQVPTTVIFCATSPTFGFGPWKNNAEVVEKQDLPCKPCRRHGSNVCPTGTESCMRDVTALDVYNSSLKVLPN